MIEASAEVVRVESDRAFVRPLASGSCGVCAGKGGCEASSLLRLFGRGDQCYSVHNGVQAKVGDRVIVGLPEGRLAKSAALTYGLPLAGLLAGAAVGGFVAHTQDLGAALGGLAGFTAGAWFVRRGDTRSGGLAEIRSIASVDAA